MGPICVRAVDVLERGATALILARIRTLMGRLTLGIRLSVDCSVRLSVSEDAQMDSYATQQAFTAALEGLVESIKEDRSILAAVLCGSLSHDTVWMKSDIDLVLVTIDDKKVESTDLARL